MATLGVMATSYPRYEGDFAGVFVREEVRRLVACGHRVRLVTPRSDLPARLRPRDRGVERFEAPTPPGLFYGLGAPEQLTAMGAPRAAALSARACAALLWTARRAFAACDALIAHWLLPSAPLCSMIAAGRPLAVRVHSAGGHLALGAPRLLQRALAASCVARAVHVAAASAPMARALTLALGRPVAWIGPASRTDSLRALPDPTPTPTLRVGFLGRRVPIKGLDLLVDAARAMVTRGAALRLVVAGPPGPVALPDLPWIEDRGVLEGEAALRRFFEAVDVVVVPSRVIAGRTEGLPCALIEACAAGRPVVASDVGGARALTPPAWRVRPGHRDDLIRALDRLAAEPATRLAEGAAARARLASLEARWDAGRDEALRALGLAGARRPHPRPRALTT